MVPNHFVQRGFATSAENALADFSTVQDLASTPQFGSFHPNLDLLGLVVVRNKQEDAMEHTIASPEYPDLKISAVNYGVLPAAAAGVLAPPAEEIRGAGMLPLYIELIA